MIVTAWKSGRHDQKPAGYGLRLKRSDLASFRREWKFVNIVLPDGRAFKANIDKGSMWKGNCRELISKDFGEWILRKKLAPWPLGNPPKFSLEKIQGNTFKLTIS